MNTGDLALPNGCISARFIDGMRELCQYNAVEDEYVARWDTYIGGEHRILWADPLPAQSLPRPLIDWLEDWRAVALAKFKHDENAGTR